MVKTGWFFLPLCLLSLLVYNTAAAEEQVQLLNLYDPLLQTLYDTGSSSSVPVIAISVSNEHLKEVSSSVVKAESWVKQHVLAHYPSTNITTIVVGDSVFCSQNQLHYMGLVLPSVKNIYYSLTRWGLHKEIRVSVSFSSNCFSPQSASEKYVKPVLMFLQDTMSAYLVNPPPNLSPFSDEIPNLVSSHLDFMKKLGVLNLKRMNLIIPSSNGVKPTSRKLSFLDFKISNPFPPIPTPLPTTKTPIGYSVPAYGAKTPLPPLVGPTFAPPPFSLPASPPEAGLPPMLGPSSPYYGFNWPPCNPSGGGGVAPVGAPETGEKQGMWCVAKPSVPAETLQEAMDYACGDGGADCEAIGENGNCHYPDTVVAHASYAFNSYWQKNKINGGTCSFGGTAMIINSDPSFRHCRFDLN